MKDTEVKSKEVIYRIILPYACYGIITVDGIITLAPPIASWAVGKSITEFIKWIELKGGIVEKQW